MANDWDNATATPEGAKYLPLPEKGDNVFQLRMPDGSERVLYAHPERGPEHAIGELLNPPPREPVVPVEPVDARIAKLEARIAALEAKRA